jgi:hypothetical protein
VTGAAVGALAFVPALLALVERRPREQRAPGIAAATVLARSPVRAAAGLALSSLVLLAVAAPALGGATVPFAAGAAGADDSLLAELPIPAAVAAAVIAIALGLASRIPRAALLAPFALVPAAAAIGATVFVFEDGNLAEPLGVSTAAGVDTGAVAIAIASLVAIGAARATATAVVVGTQRRLGFSAARAAARAGEAILAATTCASLVGALAGGALVAADVAPLQQLGLALAVGLLADLLLRAPLIAAAAHLGGRGRIRWRGWRRPRQTAAGTASAS